MRLLNFDNIKRLVTLSGFYCTIRCMVYGAARHKTRWNCISGLGWGVVEIRLEFVTDKNLINSNEKKLFSKKQGRHFNLIKS